MAAQIATNHLETGRRFGRLVVLGYSHTDKFRQRSYLCRCDCGVEKAINRCGLVSGRTLSCGCYSRLRASEANLGECNSQYKDGRSKTKLYRLWHGIFERCYDPKHISYPNYGGKGITICEEWKIYEVFRDWAVGNGYQDGLSIDRVDSKQEYHPDNCKWVTRAENTANGNRDRHK